VKRIDELARRRARLVVHCTAERDEIARQASDLTRSLAWVERGSAVAGWITTRPWMVALVATALVAAGPAAIVRWAARALDVAHRLGEVFRSRDSGAASSTEP